MTGGAGGAGVGGRAPVGPDGPEGHDPRAAELVSALGRVRARVSDACAAAGRSAAATTLVVVTKTHPVSDVAVLASLGVRDVGEAREQELRDKQDQLEAPGLRWHLVGRLQRNKARSVGRLADVVHSVDDPRLLPRLSEGAGEVGRELGCFVQVSLDGDPARGGVGEDRLLGLAAQVAGTASLRLLGLMAVAPVGADPDDAFARLQELSARVAEQHPTATAVSAGMSGDLEAALRHGATHLRVGAAVLGSRPPTV